MTGVFKQVEITTNQHLFFWESNIFRQQFDTHTHTRNMKGNAKLYAKKYGAMKGY